MAHAKRNYERLRALQTVGPHFFHVTSGRENGLYIGDLQAETQASEIQTHITTCKPGIWASSYRHSSQLGTPNNIGRDAIVRWVTDGELNLNGPAENWKSEQHGLLRQYEQFDASQFTWRRHGNLWVDGGMANILSMAYLKPLTASSIQGWDLFSEEPDFNKEIGVYFSILARGGSWFVTGDSSREGYTIGGMSFHIDDGSAPIWVARNESEEVIAVRIYLGQSEEEDLAMIGFRKETAKSHLHTKTLYPIPEEQALQDAHLRTMLLEQAAKKLHKK